MKLALANGVTSVVLRVKVPDTTSDDPNAGLTGLTFESAGLKISTIADNEATPTVYNGGNIETIDALGTFAAPTAGKCRFKAVDAANHPGLYEIQIANARWAVSGARSVVVTVSGATNAGQVDAEIQLANVPADERAKLGTALTETSPGYLAAAFKKLFDVATPVFTAASVNQTADGDVKSINGSTLAAQALAARYYAYQDDAVVLMADGATDVLRGTALYAAIATARSLTPGGNAKSATNRVKVVGTGRCDLGTGDGTNHGALLDTEFMDLIGLTGDPDDFVITSQIATASRGTIEQTANDVWIRGVSMNLNAATAGSGDTRNSAYFPANNLPLTKLLNCKTGISGAGGYGMRIVITYSGWYEGCTHTGNEGFGGGGGTASGTFINCTHTGSNGFGAGTASGTFINCTHTGSNGLGGYGTASGTFINCTHTGSNGFGAGTASGTFIRCVGIGTGNWPTTPTGKLQDCMRGVQGSVVLIDNVGPREANATQIKTVDADTAITARVDASTLAGKFAGITLVAKWLRGLFRKDAMDATAKSEVNDGGGTFDEAMDSLEAQQEFAVITQADTNELQGDWANAGRLDTILDAAAASAATAAGHNDPLDATDTQAAAAAALTAYDPPTNAEMEARTKLAAEYADKATLGTVATDVAGLDGAAMRGTDNAALAATALSNVIWTDAKAGYLTGAVALEATLTAIKGAGWTTETLTAIDALIDTIKIKTDLIPVGTSTLTDQQVRDAMKLTPSSNAPAAGSIDKHLDTIEAVASAIVTADVTFTSPVATDGGLITLYQGDDYLQVDARQLAWTATGWPTLTDGDVEFSLLTIHGGRTAVLSKAGVITAAKACYVELTTVETAALPSGSYTFGLVATLSDGSIVTLAEGRCTVKPKLS